MNMEHFELAIDNSKKEIHQAPQKITDRKITGLYLFNETPSTQI